MTRDMLSQLDEAKIGVAPGTYAIVKFPPVKIERMPQSNHSQRRQDDARDNDWSKSPEPSHATRPARDTSQQ